MRHVGAFPALEDEMCDFALGGLSSGRSPDRLDALVWALSALMLTKDGKPRVRGICDAGASRQPLKRSAMPTTTRTMPTMSRRVGAC